MSENNLVLRWGIVSAGKISYDFATALKTLKSDRQVLQGVAARSIADAQKFASHFNIPSAYSCYDELFNDANVNIVYIGSINTAHKEHCLKAIAAGKHVLCEHSFSNCLDIELYVIED
jgi:dihydrodiol dehydrogenase / D-xylose 1-dehydrogenase (NADP)